ncbi:MAG: Adaptive-response sensory-kinase SasA [Chlamydiales bacterium]|nr:Adaptive-response sensory-kinase SasA [Chlamydiales bacterium]
MRFRQKILISFLIIFLIFTVFMYPVVTRLIGVIQERNLRNRTIELIQSLESAPTFKNLIERLSQREKFLFFRVSLLDPYEGYLYDSHRETGGFDNERLLTHHEVKDALVMGSGYDVRFSPLFGQEMAYMAVSFQFRDKEYVMRTAFPYGQISTMTHDLTLTFLILGIGVLLLFSFLAWFIIHILTRPVQHIIEAIKPYQLGKVDHIPEIKLGKDIRPGDEFGNLAETFNSLSRHIDHQISSLTHERNEKSAILESLVEGVIAVDETLTVIYMNRMAGVFLGIEEKSLVGQNFSEANQPSCSTLILEAQKKGQPVVLVIKPERKQKRYLDAVAVPRGKGGAILVLQDKTSLHKVIELGRDFIANASHELKTPITIIRGFAETLHDHPELTREVYGEITQKIVSNCQRMDTLVKNLLTLAAVDEGLPRSRLQECDLFDIAEQAKITLLVVHPDAKIEIETKGEEPFSLLADSDLFYQAILNLLDNAVKYSAPPAVVTVLIEKGPAEFHIHVSDRGVGIPGEDLDRVFERFYAVDKSHSRSLGGSGLGLSIVERIVEKHQGRIEVESEFGKGTTFTITLPILDD